MLDKNIEAATNWILNSGIQGSDGGFNSWYDLDKKTYKYKYSEITGYGITTLLFLNKINPNNIFIEKAKAAARWLINNSMHPCDGFKTRSYYPREDENEEYSFNNSRIFSFDTGIVLNGLINLYKETKDERLLNYSLRSTNFLINKMQRDDGLFNTTYDPNNDEMINTLQRWSSQSGSYHAKIAIPLINLYEITNNEEFKEAAIKICGSSLKFQVEDGRFISFADSNDTHLHPHLYTLEGLFYVANKLRSEKQSSLYIDSVKKSLFWTLKNQKNTGGFPQLYYHKEKKQNEFERTDINAQVLRKSLLLRSYGILGEEYDHKINMALERLKSFQHFSDEKTNGGFYFGYDQNGEKLNHLNSWCTMFALQGLIYYNQFNSGQKLDMEFLI